MGRIGVVGGLVIMRCFLACVDCRVVQEQDEVDDAKIDERGYVLGFGSRTDWNLGR